MTGVTFNESFSSWLFKLSELSPIFANRSNIVRVLVLRYFENIPVKTHANFNINDKFKEAMAFALLGIGNAVMQASLNPLVSNIVSEEKLASFMTFGQFVKAIGSFIAPILAAWFAAKYNNWALMYAVFAVEALIALILLGREEIKEEISGKITGFKDAFSLLGDGMILLCFIGIMCHVGIDVGTNTVAPQILMERLGWPLSQAIYATSVYFMFRTVGCFLGAFLLAKISAKKVFVASVFFMLAAMCGMFFSRNQWLLYGCIALIGLGNSNIFSIIFSQAFKWLI